MIGDGDDTSGIERFEDSEHPERIDLEERGWVVFLPQTYTEEVLCMVCSTLIYRGWWPLSEQEKLVAGFVMENHWGEHVDDAAILHEWLSNSTK